ncbi:hypothetical protein LSTR_LSTR001325 [Laodelphax striatellus]|uniref:Uncharacterized protein n=1 Tax=Laodelphax striatellus TaxID=195883 RepID=A0A482XFQ3_LAOST|nr:hypothetical protein LSTR_LSTR001325 [Laodelphax striatellus]
MHSFDPPSSYQNNPRVDLVAYRQGSLGGNIVSVLWQHCMQQTGSSAFPRELFRIASRPVTLCFVLNENKFSKFQFAEQ